MSYNKKGRDKSHPFLFYSNLFLIIAAHGQSNHWAV
jgi:hypothetical protein